MKYYNTKNVSEATFLADMVCKLELVPHPLLMLPESYPRSFFQGIGTYLSPTESIVSSD